MGTGTLTVVGTGFGGVGQVTLESCGVIQNAEKVLYLVDNRIVADWIVTANPRSESLAPFYRGRADRLQTYMDMTDHILSFVRGGLDVCAVFYGHPGVFVIPSHEAVIRAREEGYEARMMPAISAEDCLFADLGVDPGRRGCQTFEATDFLVRKRQIETSVPLVLWQVGSVGQLGDGSTGEFPGRAILSKALQSLYGPKHEVIIYEAGANPQRDFIAEFIPLDLFESAVLTPASTLYVPPGRDPEIDFEMARRLGISEDYLARAAGRGTRYGASRPYASPKPRLR